MPDIGEGGARHRNQQSRQEEDEGRNADRGYASPPSSLSGVLAGHVGRPPVGRQIRHNDQNSLKSRDYPGTRLNATAIRVFEDDFLVINMSVWKDIDSLHQYVYKSDHADIYKRRKEWFSKMTEMHMALWYVPIGHQPSPIEAREKLEFLQEHGETPAAFSFRKNFSAAGLPNF